MCHKHIQTFTNTGVFKNSSRLKILVTKCFHSTVDMAFFLVESVMVLTALLYTQYQVLPLYQKELGIFGLGDFKLLFYMTLQEKKNIVKVSYILQRCIVSTIKN